ncbi:MULTISPECIES: hypothetical protein [Pseudovibrio]|uniref:hypothetical protein n=1 Tax=Stappiaceae TaxID=2821832 RepID=UPI00236602F7|nr:MULTISPECIES: hypothetical protein [Pseudovibrio]MDD7910698.1 hypothetical protein [Pseudovibrio exalbescens]MDX5594463.1 hypothetical protein [Pseudovibrio sp. SPO723]
MSEGAPLNAASNDDRVATATYCEKMCQELAKMARSNDLSFLAYLLSMAEEEARQERQKGAAPETELKVANG